MVEGCSFISSASPSRLFLSIPPGTIPSQASLFHNRIIARVGPYVSELFSFSFLLCATIRFIFLQHLFRYIIPLLANLKWFSTGSQIRLLCLAPTIANMAFQIYVSKYDISFKAMCLRFQQNTSDLCRTVPILKMPAAPIRIHESGEANKINSI